MPRSSGAPSSPKNKKGERDPDVALADEERSKPSVIRSNQYFKIVVCHGLGVKCDACFIVSSLIDAKLSTKDSRVRVAGWTSATWRY
jgi:hypothetical protein